jgi:hypothetical protein
MNQTTVTANQVALEEREKNNPRAILHRARAEGHNSRVMVAKLERIIKKDVFQLNCQVKQLKRELNDTKDLLHATKNIVRKNNLELEELRKLNQQNKMKKNIKRKTSTIISDNDLIVID